MALLVLAINLPLWTTGCATMTTDFTSAARGESRGTGSFRAAIFDRGKDVRTESFTTHRVESELYREDAGGDVLVTRSAEPAFEATDLAPGKYRLRVSGWRDGNDTDSPSATRQKKFTIERGMHVEAKIVLNDYGAAISTGVALGVVVLVAAVVAALSSSWKWGGSSKGIKFDRAVRAPLTPRDEGPCRVETQVACEPVR
jgi:hypothetical protein